jgi:hypothetical protein
VSHRAESVRSREDKVEVIHGIMYLGWDETVGVEEERSSCIGIMEI